MSGAKFLVKRDSGQVEVAGASDKIGISTVDSLAVTAQDTPNRTVNILSGYVIFSNKNKIDIADTLIDMGTGSFQLTAMPASYYNKIRLSIDPLGTVIMYQGIPAALSSGVITPEIPENEVQLCEILVQDDGSAGAGTIIPVTSTVIIDLRPFFYAADIGLNALRPLYFNPTLVTMQQGGVWFDDKYLTLPSDVQVVVDTSSNTAYYIYLDYNLASGGVTGSSFVTLTTLPDPSIIDFKRYMPLGSYSVATGAVQKASVTAYNSKFWRYKNTPYSTLQEFTSAGTTTFITTNFTFASFDYLAADINGIEVYEGASNDYTRVVPNQVIFNYTVQTNAVVTIKKL